MNRNFSSRKTRVLISAVLVVYAVTKITRQSSYSSIRQRAPIFDDVFPSKISMSEKSHVPPEASSDRANLLSSSSSSNAQVVFGLRLIDPSFLDRIRDSWYPKPKLSLPEKLTATRSRQSQYPSDPTSMGTPLDVPSMPVFVARLNPRSRVVYTIAPCTILTPVMMQTLFLWNFCKYVLTVVVSQVFLRYSSPDIKYRVSNLLQA
jgi:hypothetical protein